MAASSAPGPAIRIEARTLEAKPLETDHPVQRLLVDLARQYGCDDGGQPAQADQSIAGPVPFGVGSCRR